MEEIEIGDYVRTDKGHICKIDKDKKNLDIIKFLDVEYGDVVRHSKNIIDLIEVGDYVNGYKVDDIKNNKIIIGDTTQVIEQIIENEDIKSIVTSEQFKSIEYIVEE